jgi:hypothetical protein
MKSSGATLMIFGSMVSLEILTLTMVLLPNSFIWIMMTGSDLLSVCWMVKMMSFGSVAVWESV